MDLALQIGIWGGLVPALVALALGWTVWHVVPPPWAERYALPVALAGSFVLGYILLPDWAAMVPERHWHWLPWLGPVAASIAGIRRAEGLAATERLLLTALLATVVAWFVVPTWDDLKPVRPWSVALLAAYMAALALTLDALPNRLVGRSFVGLLAAVTAGLALVIAARWSLKYGQMAGILAASLAGCCLAMWKEREASGWRSVVLVYVALACSLAYVGYVEPSPPLMVAIVMPAAPLLLWLFAAGPFAGLSGWRATLVQSAVVLAPVAVAVGWAVLYEGSGDGY